MVQGFYTLEEAAQRLGLPAHELNLMAQRREVRAFADRGTWRFRVEEIEELARRRGMGSDPDLPLRDTRPPSSPKKPAPLPTPEVFPFELKQADDSGTDIFSVVPGSQGPPGSDSDVRLVPEGSNIDVKPAPAKAPESKTAKAPSSKTGSSSKVGPGSKVGSGSKLVPDSDSDVKLVDIAPDDSVVPIGREDRPQSDSDVRLETSSTTNMPDSEVRIVDAPPRIAPIKPGSDETLLIGEIDLEQKPRRTPARTETEQPAALQPFELSNEDVDFSVSSSATTKPRKDPDSSDLASAKTSELPSDNLFDSSTEEIKLDSSGELDLAPAVSSSDEEQPAGGLRVAPSDSGLSLEEENAEGISFELSVEDGPPSPRPATAEKDSSSEFELTLDDSGELASSDEEHHDTELLQTDLKMPAVGEEVGSDLEEAAADDESTDLETSDFELALDDDELGSDEESVVIDEDAEEGDATAVRPSLDEDEVEELFAGEEVEDLVIDEAVEEEEEETETAKALALAAAASQPAEWGWWSLLHIPTTLVLIFVGFLLFEMIRSINGYSQPGPISSMVFDLIGKNLK